MSEEVKTDRESQFTALQVVVQVLVQASKGDPEFLRKLEAAARLDGFKSLTPEEKAKVTLSIKRLTGL